MKTVDLTKLPAYLKAQRWFAGKAWPIKAVTLVDHAVLPDASDKEDAILAVVEVTYELGSPERYVLAVRPTDTEVVDAFHDNQMAGAALGVIRDQKQVPAGSGVLRGERIPGYDAIWSAIGSRARVRQIAGEQSNTSLIFEDTIILKLIRKLEAGINPEYEMGKFLALHGCSSAPPMLGALHLEGVAGTTLAVAHEYIPDATDGWRHLLARFRAEPRPGAPLRKELEQLGRAVGELHTVLASDAGDPAFSPEPVQLEDLQRWSSSIIGELGVTLNELSRAGNDLFHHREGLVKQVQRLAHLNPSGKKIRIHGDLHLGQVLRAKGAWRIFDFEGEPARKFAQRREKQSPLRDVAGMLRSFAYAQATLEREGIQAADAALAAREEFLSGYLRAVSDKSLLPEADADFTGALQTFELEKLLYEVRYELNNRPEWVQIPLGTLVGSLAPEGQAR